MIPLGKTLYLWRVKRKLTQAELARRAGISRPNLSVMEQGGRDMTVGTLNRLAEVLGIRPGILADCIPPFPIYKKPFLRRSLDRIARVVVGGHQKLTRGEKRLAEIVKKLVQPKLKIGKLHSRILPNTAQEQEITWLRAHSEFNFADVKNVILRVDKYL